MRNRIMLKIEDNGLVKYKLFEEDQCNYWCTKSDWDLYEKMLAIHRKYNISLQELEELCELFVAARDE